MKKIFSLIFCTCTLLYCQVAVEKGTFRFEGKDYECVRIENGRIKITAIPALGGRIAEIIDSSDNLNVVQFGNYGGFLDDHETRTVEKYQYEIKKSQENNSVSLRMWNTKNEITYIKTITVRPQKSLIEIEYEILNESQEDLGKIMIRNTPKPGGEPLSENDVYITPMEYGIIKSSPYYKDLEKIGQPWKAFVNIPKKKGVAVWFEDDYLSGFYDWYGSVGSRTFEWFYKPLPAGKGVKTRFYLAIINGFDEYSSINKYFVASTKVEGENIDIRIMPLWEDLKNLNLEIEILDFNRRKIADIEPVKVDSVIIENILGTQRKFNFDSKKNYLIFHKVYSKGTEIGRFEVPIMNVKDGYNIKPVFEKKFRLFDVPGWKKLTVEPDIKKSDIERGYIIYTSTNPSHTKQIEIDAGMDEFESYQLILRTLKETEKFFISYPENFDKNIEIKIAEVLSTEIWKKKVHGQKLLSVRSFTGKKDEDVHIWLILNSKGLKPGRYKIEISIRPENAVEEKIVVNFNVWNVKFPERQPLFVFSPNTLFNYFCVDKIQPPHIAEWEWNFKKAHPYAIDLYQHGVRQITGYSWHNVGYGYKYIYFRDNGKKLLDSKNEISPNNLPGLDFATKWDPYIHYVIDSGFTTYRSTLGNIKSYRNNFSDLAKTLGIDQDKFRVWYLGEIVKYFKEKGFDTVYASIDDEIPEDEFPSWVEVAKEAKNLGYAPGCTWSNLLLENEKNIKLIASACDFWTIGTYNPELLEKRKQQGYIEEKDYLQTYVSSATWWQKYEDMRFHCGWLPAFGGLKGTWIQEYWRWNQDACIIFLSESGPIGSAAWEGARDGFEDANYYLIAKTLLALAEKNVGEKKIKHLKERMGKIIGYGDDTILRVKMEQTRLGEIVTFTRTPDQSFREAKRELLSIITDVKKFLPSQKPDLFFHHTQIIKNGKPLYKIYYQNEKENAEFLGDYIFQQTGVRIKKEKPGNRIETPSVIIAKRGEKIIETLTGMFPDLTEGITNFYPPEKGYVIKQNDNVILIFGSDDEGIRTGTANFARFLKISQDYWKQYYKN